MKENVWQERRKTVEFKILFPYLGESKQKVKVVWAKKIDIIRDVHKEGIIRKVGNLSLTGGL